MPQDPGGGQGEVDWDAVFRTIDHQQEGTDVAVAVNSGTLQSGVDQPQWQAEVGSHSHAHAHARGHGHGIEGGEASEAELLEYLSRQWNHSGPSNQNRRNTALEPRTMDPSSGLGFGLERQGSSTQQRPAEHSEEKYDLAFRAMLGDGNEGLVPPPQNRSLRGRRRSRSLGPRRTLSDIQTGLGPLTGPLSSHPTLSHHNFPSDPQTPLRPFATPSTLLHQNNPDVYSFFPPQNEYQTNTAIAGPSTPYLPQPYTRPGQVSDPQSLQSQWHTPLNSALPSPQQLTTSAYRTTRVHGDDPPSSTDQGSSSEPTPGTELDSEDKRARNTLASARFRAKRKAHINDVERQITQLEGQSTTLQKQVQDLRKENGFLKDMVQLKYGLDVDKRV